MSLDITEFDVRAGAIDGLLVVAIKQVTDARGTIREVFRRSAFESAGVDLAAFEQINVTETRRGAVRGMHAEEMTKLVTVAAGEVYGAYVDLRSGSPTFGVVDQMPIVPGVQVLVPAGVANGFQTISDVSHYLYCFDREWQPGMPGRSVSVLDPSLSIDWPLPIDADDPMAISPKDRDAPRLGDLR